MKKKMKTLTDTGVYNMEEMCAYNMEKTFSTLSLNLSEEAFAKLNSIIEKEQQKQKKY